MKRRLELGIIGIALVLALGVLGCADPTGDVSGKVSYRGKPLKGGYVDFVSQGKHPKTLVSIIQEDGSYTVRALPVGSVRIAVQGVRVPGGSLLVPGAEPSTENRELSRKARDPVYVPYKFGDADTSGLLFTVESGTQTHDIDLNN